jgi:4-hydroxy-tetrahydrodipicolinate synthase
MDNGTSGLVPAGTTGESPTLSHQEHQRVIDLCIKESNGKIPVIAGTGSNSTKEAISLTSHAEKVGANGALIVTPYYNKPSQEGIVAHYKTISKATVLPIILYNVPGRTSSSISASTTLKLANQCDNIIAIKEASGNLEQIMEIILNKPKGFLVISGDDALTLPHLSIGGDGVISVVANAFPRRFSTMVNSAIAGKMDLAKEKHYELFEIIQFLFADGNPGGIKYVLKLISICEDHVRLPLVNINEQTAKKLYELVAAIDDTLA